jgi:hypothetical protein
MGHSLYVIKFRRAVFCEFRVELQYVGAGRQVMMITTFDIYTAPKKKNYIVVLWVETSHISAG